MSKSKKPRIGITGPDKGGAVAWLFTSLSVLVSGGIPVRIRPTKVKQIASLQGLIIGGGADVNPDTYEKEDFMQEFLNHTLKNKKQTLIKRITSFIKLIIYPLIFLLRKLFSEKDGSIDKERDKLEFFLLDEALKKGIPVLGICRGAQLINVFFKGDLHQDIHNFYQEHPNQNSIFPVKKVILKPGSKLSAMLETETLYVNALHHQAVNKAGEGIRIVAVEPNGVVQGIESTRYYFIVGVQWHPEYLIASKTHRKIFECLVKSALVREKIKA